MSIQNLDKRVSDLEKRGGNNLMVCRMVYENWEDMTREALTPEEEAILQKHEDEVIAAAKPGQGIVGTWWTKEKAQELLALAGQETATLTSNSLATPRRR